MQKRTIATMVVVGCAAAMLTGCGVKQEIHDAVVADLNTAMQDIEALNVTITEKDAALDKEKSALRKAGVELTSANERIQTAKTKEAETAAALSAEQTKVSSLEGQLSSEKSRVASAQQDASALEGELATLQDAYKLLEARWKQFEDNLNTLDKTVGSAKAPTAPAVAPAAADKSTVDLLSEMEGL